MKITRNYHVSDARFLEHSEVVAATLPDDLPDFTAFDATITGDYVTQLQQTIDDAKTVAPDEVIKSEMEEETQKVIKAMNDCYADYKTLAYFVRKAYKDNPAVRNQFGLNEIRKASKNQAEFVVFMESLAKTAAKYSAELVQAGCQQALIDGLAGKATTLNDANVAQEKFKKERGLSTQNRVQLLNKVYDLLRPLHNVALNIYWDQPQRLSVYTMPQPPKKAESASEPPATPESSQ